MTFDILARIMEFSKNSWHYKLVERVFTHRYFYTVDFEVNFKMDFTDPLLGLDKVDHVVRKQKNISLCKYFWSVVLGCVLMAIYIPINYLFFKPIEFLAKRYDLSWPSYKLHVSPENERKVGYTILIIASIIGGIAITYGLLHNFWQTIIELILISGIVGASFALYGLGKLVEYLLTRRVPRERRIKEFKKPNIVMEAIKAKKSRVCPILDFVDEDSKDNWYGL